MAVLMIQRLEKAKELADTMMYEDSPTQIALLQALSVLALAEQAKNIADQLSRLGDHAYTFVSTKH